MSELTLAILRRTTGIVLLTSRRDETVEIPEYESSLCVAPYVEQIVTLEEAVSDLNQDHLRDVQAAWARLACVTEYDECVAADITEVLNSTLPDDVHPTVEPWRAPVVPRSLRASAAHPRGFRGTKFQPPTPGGLPSVDLRPHLCNLRDTREILAHLGPAVMEDLAKAIAVFEVPREIRVSFWMYWLSNAKFERCCGLFWDLQLDQNEPLRRAVARVMRDPWDAALDWVQAARLLAPDRRACFMEAVLHFGVPSILIALADTNLTLDDVVHRLSELCDDLSFRMRAWALLQCFRDGDPVCALLDGFKLSNEYHPGYNFINCSLRKDCPIEAIVLWIEHVRRAKDISWDLRFHALYLWGYCNEIEGLSDVLRDLAQNPEYGFGKLNPSVAFECMSPLQDCCYADSFDEADAQFAALRPYLVDYFKLIHRLPEGHQKKAISIFRRMRNDYSSSTFPRVIPKCFELLDRVCREPFAKYQEADRVYSSMLELSEGQFDRWLRGDDQAVLSIDRASRNENKGMLVAKGLKRLASSKRQELVDLMLDGLQHCPAVTLHAAQALGCLSNPSCREVLERSTGHPLSLLESSHLEELTRAVIEHRPHGVHNPLPRKVRDAVEETSTKAQPVSLTSEQETRAVTKIQEQLRVSRIDLLRHIALESLARSMGLDASDAEDAAIGHALKMQNQADENQRALRKFLRAYFAGNANYLNEHSANQQWLAAHPKVDAQRWLSSFSLEASDSKGMLTLSVETNPLESLRLGSYVGSCLGIGGMLAASAAAVVLDINKTVVYARNKRGKVVARQLLAISESDQLVPYSVYPQSTTDTVRHAFIAFDQSFADHLAIPLHDPTSDNEITIAKPISSYWWDDSPWDPETEMEV